MRHKAKVTVADACLRSEGRYRPDLCKQDDGPFTLPESDAWVDKYAPISLEEVCGNDEAKNELRQSVAQPLGKPIVCYGGPGIGKRAAVLLALRERGMQVCEYSLATTNLADIKSETDPNENVLLAMRGDSQPRAIVCTDPCALSKNERNELILLLRGLSQSTRCVLIDGAPHARCHCIAFDDIDSEAIGTHLAWIAAEEGVLFDESRIPPTGDMRACVNAMQLGQMCSIWSPPGDPNYLVAARAAEIMLSHDRSCEACAALADAMSLVDCAPIGDRNMANEHAAAITAAHGFDTGTASTQMVRHAQNAGRRSRVRAAWRAWGLSPVGDAMAGGIMRQRFQSHQLAVPNAEAAHALTIVCRPSTATARRHMSGLVKAAAARAEAANG